MLGIRISKHEGILRRAIRAITRQKAVVAILIMLLGMLFFDTKFFTSYNLLDMLKSAAIIEIIAFGVTLTILCGGVDFSVGGTMSLSGFIVIKLMSMMPLWSAIVIAVLVGALIGFVNGFFTLFSIKYRLGSSYTAAYSTHTLNEVCVYLSVLE